MFNLYADVDARSMTPSRNARSYTLRSVPSSPGRSFFDLNNAGHHPKGVVFLEEEEEGGGYHTHTLN